MTFVQREDENANARKILQQYMKYRNIIAVKGEERIDSILEEEISLLFQS
jgi:hypothetical protein